MGKLDDIKIKYCSSKDIMKMKTQGRGWDYYNNNSKDIFSKL